MILKPPNGKNMFYGTPVCWEVMTQYFNNTGKKFYNINLGNMDDVIICNYHPEERILSISHSVYSDDCSLKIEVSSLKKAGIIIEGIAKANNFNISETIYNPQYYHKPSK